MGERHLKKTCFCAASCIDGSCPNAQYEAAEEKWGGGIAEDMGLERISCIKCGWNTRKCEDCIFQNSEYCQERKVEAGE